MLCSTIPCRPPPIRRPRCYMMLAVLRRRRDAVVVPSRCEEGVSILFFTSRAQRVEAGYAVTGPMVRPESWEAKAAGRRPQPGMADGAACLFAWRGGWGDGAARWRARAAARARSAQRVLPAPCCRVQKVVAPPPVRVPRRMRVASIDRI